MISETLDKNADSYAAAKERSGMCSGYGFSLLTDEDLYLFNQGSHSRAYNKLGAHRLVREGVEGTYFAVWAPDAERVFVTGSFNDWDKETDELHPRGNSGIWEGFVAGVDRGALYKYFIHSRFNGSAAGKGRSVCLSSTRFRRGRASIVWDLELFLGRSGVDGQARRAQFAVGTNVDLRNSFGLLAAHRQRRQSLAILS